MKTPKCYFNMNLRLDRRTTFWLFISVKLKHAKELTYKLLHLYICCPCTDRCHLAENACQNVTNIKRCTSCVSVMYSQVPRRYFFCGSFMFLFSLVFAMSLCASVYMCFVVTCWERADLSALVCSV